MRFPRSDPRWRSAAELVLALPAGWVVHRILPLADDDPFRPTLVILPLAVAALAALARHAPRRAEGRPEVGSGAEAAGLTVLVLLTLGRESFGLAATDWFLAGGYLLLLARRVARLLILWRPSLGLSSGPGAPPAAFFLLPLVVYLALQPWQAGHRPLDGDEPYYLLITHSLAHDFDADLADNYAREDWRAFMDRPIEPQPGDPRGAAGQVYSRHNVLLPLVLTPAYLVAGRWGAMAMMAIFSAALAFKVLDLGLRWARPGAALLAYGVFAFAPPLLIYSYQIWIEVPAALVVLLALDRIRTLERGAPSGRAGPGGIAVLALLLVALPLLKLRLGLVALPLAALAIYRIRPPRRVLLVLAGGTAAAFVGLLGYNALRYGNLLKIHSWAELDLFSSSFADFARGAAGMFYDVAFGLFPSAPIWFLVLPAAWRQFRRRERTGPGRLPGDLAAGDMAFVALPYLVALAPRFEWYGGWSPPFRYAVVFLPLFALFLAPLFELRHRPGLRLAAAALGAVTLVLALVWIVVPGWTYSFADGRTHLLDAAGVRLGADLARFFPSTVRPRLATWIWPPASLLLIPLVLWNARARPALRRRSAGILGVAGVLVFAAALPLLARTWPTRTIEVEDEWVVKERGVVFPDPWVLERPRYPGGWVIPPRGRVAARPVPGGARARLVIFLRVVNPSVPARLRVAAGERALATIDVRPGGWRQVEIGPVEWPPGEALVLRGGGTRFRGRVAVDRVELTWE